MNNKNGTLIFRLSAAMPRISDLAAFIDGVIHIHQKGIPQEHHLHPDDFATFPPELVIRAVITSQAD